MRPTPSLSTEAGLTLESEGALRWLVEIVYACNG
jgi:hypothetical protein